MEKFSYKPVEGTVQKTTKYGTYVSISSREKPKRTPGETAWHEAAHTVVAGRIHSATIIRNGDALGATTPERMTPAAAAAAAADGHGGTGWDEFLTEKILGVSFSAAQAAARSELAGKHLEKEEIAIALEESGTIGQSHVDQAYEEARKRKNGIVDVFVEVEDAQGYRKAFHTKTFHEEVQIPTDLIEGKEVSLNKKDYELTA